MNTINFQKSGVNITVCQLDEDKVDDMRLNLSESAPSEFQSMGSAMSRSSSNSRDGKKCQEISPRSICSQGSQGMTYLSLNGNMQNCNISPTGGKQDSNTYCTPEGKSEEVCDSARYQPKFMQFGV